MEGKITAQQIRILLSNKLEGISRAEISGMSLEVFPRLMEALDHQSHCQQCKKYIESLMPIAEDIAPVFRGSSNIRVNFENLVSEAMRHLTTSHGMIPKGRVKSLFLLGGSVAGLLAGVIVVPMLIPEAKTFESALLGWISVILPAWIAGNLRENQLKKQKKLF